MKPGARAKSNNPTLGGSAGLRILTKIMETAVMLGSNYVIIDIIDDGVTGL